MTKDSTIKLPEGVAVDKLDEYWNLAFSKYTRAFRRAQLLDAADRAKLWEALKAKNAAKQVTKLSREDGSEYLMLSNISSFNTEVVRRTWDAYQRAAREAYRLANPGTNQDYDAVPYTWIRELWTDFIIIESEGARAPGYLKVPYTVDSNNVVTFGEPETVEMVWKDSNGELSITEKTLLKDILIQK